MSTRSRKIWRAWAHRQTRRSPVVARPIPAPRPIAPQPSTLAQFRSVEIQASSGDAPSMPTSIACLHWRHGCPICSAAPSGQLPKPHRGAPKARDLTPKAWTELPSIGNTDACQYSLGAFPKSRPCAPVRSFIRRAVFARGTGRHSLGHRRVANAEKISLLLARAGRAACRAANSREVRPQTSHPYRIGNSGHGDQAGLHPRGLRLEHRVPGAGLAAALRAGQTFAGGARAPTKQTSD